jgi:VWFA-related protein
MSDVRVRIRVCLTALLLILLLARYSPGQVSRKAPVATINVTSRLVYLDVTVVDKSGRPVVKGLTLDDFLITEDKRPQRIFSFEGPDAHTPNPDREADDTVGKAPVTIFVLDLLNSSSADFAYIRIEVEKYLNAQPAQLAVPCEIMVLGNQSLEMVQGYTRNREDLLSALHHVPAALPYKMNAPFNSERFIQSVSALQQIALQNKGIPGRKNIVWVGHGSPDIGAADEGDVIGKSPEWVSRYMRHTTDLLVDARITLFVLYLSVCEGLPCDALKEAAEFATEATLTQRGGDPFSGGLNFGVFINDTGGKLFFNRNDVAGEIKDSQELGSNYYTLTYQPQENPVEDTFRHIRVTVRNRDLRVITKTGYYPPEPVGTIESQRHVITDINEAALSSVPLQNLKMTLGSVVRHPDTGTAEFIVDLGLKDLTWQQNEEGKSTASLRLAAVCMTAQRGIAASKLERVTVQSPTEDALLRSKYITRVSLSLRLPRSTKNVRIVMQTLEGGRLGSVDLDRKTIDAAPASPTPEPTLIVHPIRRMPQGKP